MLNLDWSGYSGNMTGFVKEVHKIAGDVLLSSPNDFKGALQVLKNLN